MIILDQPWQIRCYQLAVQAHYCRMRGRGMRFKNPRSLKSFNSEHNTKCRTFAEMAEHLDAVRRSIEQENGVAS